MGMVFVTCYLNFSSEIHAFAVAGIQTRDFLSHAYLPYHLTYIIFVIERKILSFVQPVEDPLVPYQMVLPPSTKGLHRFCPPQRAPYKLDLVLFLLVTVLLRSL